MTFEWKFTVGNVITIIITACGFVYGYATLGYTVSEHERKIIILQDKQEKSEEMKLSIVRVEEKTNYIIEQLSFLRRQQEKSPH